MNTSEQVNELAAALAKAQGMMDNAIMNRINPHFKSRYADLAAIFDAARKPLAANGLAIVQTIGNGVLHTRLLHTSGQWIASEYSLPMSGRPQEIGAALTYARRYSLSALIGIAADEDDDGNIAQKMQSNVMKPITETTAPTSAASSGAVDAAPSEDTPEGGAAQSFEDQAREMADRGAEIMRKFYNKCTRREQMRINKIRPEIDQIVDEAEARILAEKVDEEAAIAEQEAEEGHRG